MGQPQLPHLHLLLLHLNTGNAPQHHSTALSKLLQYQQRCLVPLGDPGEQTRKHKDQQLAHYPIWAFGGKNTSLSPEVQFLFWQTLLMMVTTFSSSSKKISNTQFGEVLQSPEIQFSTPCSTPTHSRTLAARSAQCCRTPCSTALLGPRPSTHRRNLRRYELRLQFLL